MRVKAVNDKSLRIGSCCPGHAKEKRSNVMSPILSQVMAFVGSEISSRQFQISSMRSMEADPDCDVLINSPIAIIGHESIPR